MKMFWLAVGLSLSLAAPAHAEDTTPLKSVEGDYIVKNFKFSDGETLPQLRLHYTTLGKPARNAKGEVTNAVLILHGTGGSGHQFFRPQFANVLFKPGGLLDPAKYYIILPDDIGHGKSSKPSDGLHARFPHYGYEDMVEGEYLLVTKGLNVNHLRLVMGTSMGCMHSFMWAEEHPDFVDAAMPLACLPIQIAGRNRMWRKMVTDAIVDDPAWHGGDYKSEPQMALRAASDILVIAGSAPLPMQLDYPTANRADAALDEHVKDYMDEMDANDLLYQVAASGDYDPSKNLGKIACDVMWVNSGDDFINPPDLGIAQKMVKEIKHGRFVLIPAGPGTHGHGTHTWAALWQNDLAELLRESAGHP